MDGWAVEIFSYDGAPCMHVKLREGEGILSATENHDCHWILTPDRARQIGQGLMEWADRIKENNNV
jgi:hypothetical protein